MNDTNTLRNEFIKADNQALLTTNVVAAYTGLSVSFSIARRFMAAAYLILKSGIKGFI